VVLALASSVAFAATGLGGKFFGGPDAGAQGATAGFTGSVGAGGTLPVGSSVAVDTHGSLSAGSPATAGAIGTAVAASGGAGSVSTLGTHASVSATGSGSAQTPSVESLTGAVDGVVKQVEATVNSTNTNMVPFSTGGSAPIVGVDASSNGEAVARVP